MRIPTQSEDGATPRGDLPDVDATTTRYFWRRSSQPVAVRAVRPTFRISGG